ncbi:hypothetical protein AYO20_02849 [Fonsecaea nubica]|uniref:Major facilitator superfamily (MFS) profile domain-containing protein n=1 Tax=Fonsecaea nubica TaxID=856822 RepID=A0A178D8E1_9EURO|nr:hypothetical protein AYO20_02849 [Fonsecaea nubica]OAL38016.1 hypothetical protein AYO20_02849 [Fonsecaea nubica]
MDSAAHTTLTVSEVLALEDKKGLGLTPALIRLYLVLAPATLVVCATNGFDGSVLNALQGIDRWKDQFGHPDGALLGITSSAYALGAIGSTPFSAIVSDRFGRRWSIFIGSIIMMLGVVLQCVSKSIGLFIGGRVVVGFGISLALAAAPILLAELAHPRHRVFFSAMYNCSFALGSVLAAWVAYGSVNIPSSWAWRLPTLFQACPALIQTSAIWFLDESPRWLCYKDRGDEAFAILVKHHGGGDPNHPLPIAEYHEMCEALQQEKQMKHRGLRLFVQTPENRKRLMILIALAIFGQWSGTGLISYYLPKILDSIGITGQQEQTRLNGIVTTVNYVTSFCAVIFATKVGRRVLFVGGGTFMWLSLVGFATSVALYNEHKSTSAGRSSLGFIFIFNTGYNFCLIPTLYLYSTEILPYRLRAMGLSISVFTTKASLFFNQFVNPIGLSSIGWKYYFVYVAWVAVEVLIMFFFFPETKGHTLETMPEVFGERVLDNRDKKIMVNDDDDVHVVELGGSPKGLDRSKGYVEHVQDVGV